MDMERLTLKVQEALQEAKAILRSRLNFSGTAMSFSTERSDAWWWLMWLARACRLPCSRRWHAQSYVSKQDTVIHPNESSAKPIKPCCKIYSVPNHLSPSWLPTWTRPI